MLKLFKYELRKTMLAKLILLALTFALEGVFLYGVFTQKSGPATTGALLLAVTAIFGTMFMGIQSVMTLHHDMNTKQSYMLFLTPHSNYAILGAKVLEATLSVVLAALFFFGLGMLDVRLLLDKFGNIQQLTDFINNMLKSMGASLSLDAMSIALTVVQVAATWIETILLAFLSDVIITSLLKGKKFGGILVIVLFILMSEVTQRIAGLVPELATATATTAVKALVTLGVAAAEYVASAVIMEKKLSV